MCQYIIAIAGHAWPKCLHVKSGSSCLPVTATLTVCLKAECCAMASYRGQGKYLRSSNVLELFPFYIPHASLA